MQTPLSELYGDYSCVAGVDEVGRGPLAGPVVTAAVILNPHQSIAGLADSKKLSESKREFLAEQIKQKCVAYAYGRAEVAEIDQLNILHASLLAMQRAVLALDKVVDRVLVDGNRCPKLPMSSVAVVKGDNWVPEISAASILAKVARDEEMCALDLSYPGYGLARHKGYPTKAHLTALQQLGVSPIHRRSYAPVKKYLYTQSV